MATEYLTVDLIAPRYQGRPKFKDYFDWKRHSDTRIEISLQSDTLVQFTRFF